MASNTMARTICCAVIVTAGAIAAGCSSSDHESPPADATASADAGVDAAPDAGPQATCITPASPGSCAAPSGTALPICRLSQTGCMDPQTITQFNSRAMYYEVNSPLWSDNAAKSRAFVLPAGGTIHVKNCQPDADPASLAECVAPNGLSSGPADTGRWVFPVGTVMIKNFLFDDKLVETRLLMRVDAATAALVQNGTDWVGYNYAWNEAQTEATIVPNTRTAVQFNTGKQTVTWHYPSFLDCVNCHSAAVGTLGPEMAQMNRTVNGDNQIDAFVAKGLFDQTPAKPYAEPLVEPYANAALGLNGPPAGQTELAARSYLSANCGFCHRPDVNDQGFDLRHSLSLFDTKICNLTQQNGIPGMTDQTFVELAPGDHAASATWIRMNTPVADSDPNGRIDVGRMPTVSSFVVDPQATELVATWIDSLTSCPTR